MGSFCFPTASQFSNPFPPSDYRQLLPTQWTSSPQLDNDWTDNPDVQSALERAIIEPPTSQEYAPDTVEKPLSFDGTATRSMESSHGPEHTEEVGEPPSLSWESKYAKGLVEGRAGVHAIDLLSHRLDGNRSFSCTLDTRLEP